MSDDQLDHEDSAEADERASPSAVVVFETIRREGEAEMERPWERLAWSGLAAGLSMGFSLVAEALLHTYTPEVSWRPIIASLGYSVGFLIVILGRQQLFTENTLTPVLEVMRRKNLRTLRLTAILWGIVLVANLVGAAIFATVIAHTSLFEPQVQHTLDTLSVESMQGDFFTVWIRAVFAGWLIALMIWLMPFAETARVGVIIIVTYVIGLAGFTHIIADAVAAFYAVNIGAAGFGEFLGEFFVPVLLGNVVGGIALVAAINYAQVAAD